MRRTLHMLPVAALVLVSVVMAPGAVTAKEQGSPLDFCNGGSNCVTLSAQNGSGATAQSVTVRQLAGAGCTAETKRHTANLRGGMYGDWFAIKANKACDYEIKFVTSDGCTGNKTTKLTADRIANGYVVARMRKACGTLVTEPGKTRYRIQPGKG